MNISFGLLGQIAVCWIVLSVIASPLIGRYLRLRKAQKHLRETIRKHNSKLPRDPGERRAVVQSDSRWTESEYQKNARVAESLGFIEPDDPRAA